MKNSIDYAKIVTLFGEKFSETEDTENLSAIHQNSFFDLGVFHQPLAEISNREVIRSCRIVRGEDRNKSQKEELSLVQNTSDLIGKVKELEERLEFEKKMKDFEREKWKETNQNLLSSVNKVKSVYESQVREREEELLIEKLQKEDLSKNCQELINLVQILQEKLNSKFQTIESMQRSQVSYFSPYSSQTQILHSERKLKSYEKNLSQLVILNERLNSIIQENNTKEEEKIKKALIGQKEIYEQEIENLLVLNEKLLKINEYNNKRQNKQIKNSLIFKEKLRIENDQVEVEKLGREKIELERIIDNLKRKLEVSEEKNAYSYLIHNFHA